MRKISFLLFACFLLLVMAGCRSSRHAVTDATTSASAVVPATDGTEPATPIKGRDTKMGPIVNQGARTRTLASGVEAMAAKLNLRLESGSKRISVGGTYRLKRNDVIQINLVYTMIISVNVGSMELTRDHILILDRIHKRYCQVGYDEVPQLAAAGVDFDYLQRIFWGEAEESPTPLLQWAYSAWEALGDGQFPGQIAFTASTGSTDYKATFVLSNIRQDDTWPTRIEVGSKFSPVSLATVMKALMSVAE